MTHSIWQAGQRLTVARLDAAALIGRLVFHAYRTAAQSISDSVVAATGNALSWDDVQLDLLDGWDSGSATRYTPTEAGWYMCTGSASFAASTAGTIRGVGWLQNGALATAANARPHVTTLASATVTAEARQLPLLCNGTSDYIELAPFQNTGGALNTSTGSVRPYIAVYYVGPS